MNKTFRKAMLSTICMLVVAVVSLTGVTYAWFSQGTAAEVTGLNVQVEAATGGIMIAGASTNSFAAAGDFSNTLSLSSINFGGETGVTPVSTVGGANGFDFFKATLETPTTITTEADTSDDNVFVYYLFLRNADADVNMTINLGGNASTSAGTTGITNASANKQIATAARLGLRYIDTLDLSGTSLAEDEDAAKGNVNGDTGYGIFSNAGTAYQGVKAANDEAFAMSNPSDVTNLGAVTPTTASAWSIYVPDDSIVVVELLVWVEGQDAACINANANSAFDVTLVLDKLSETPVVAG